MATLKGWGLHVVDWDRANIDRVIKLLLSMKIYIHFYNVIFIQYNSSVRSYELFGTIVDAVIPILNELDHYEHYSFKPL